MTRGTVNVKLRPIKLAFLVNPNDNTSLLKAIEINTFLWGGAYNPIIPTYKQISSKWKKFPHEKNISAQSVVSGYLDNFDPDYVVPMGECAEYSLDIGHRQKIDNASQILETSKRYGITSYGIDFFEILHYFFEEELKFQRKYPLDICIPRFGIRFHPFLASVFGKLPESYDKIFWENFAKTLEAQKIDFSTSNYTEFFDPQNLFFRRMTALYLKPERLPKRCIFFLHATKSLDIIDYWNLRAIGWNVFPVPKQFMRSDKTKLPILDFIEKNHMPCGSNLEIDSPTTILKSRSVSEDEHREFCDLFEEVKVVSKTSYPRVWDQRERSMDHVQCREVEADTTEHDISMDEEEIRFKTLDPKFIMRGTPPIPRFANEIELKFEQGNALFAEVIPEGGWELTKDLGIFQISEWRISRKGLVYLSRHSKSKVSLPLPQAEIVFTRWLESKGWTVELSSAGRIAKQMILQLGRESSVWFLAQKGILQLLNKMNSSDQKSVSEEFVRGEVQKIANQVKYKREGGAERIIQELIDAKVFQLGMEIQCSICTKHSWYSVKAADYALQCPQCLSQISFPPDSKKVKWAYRTLGPFSSSNQADGAYTVLLTLRFFSHLLLLDGATTPLMSFKAEKERIKIEADLALFFQVSGLINSSHELIFSECKTFNDFKKKDVERMTDLGKAFPDAVLVFATLKEQLSANEKKNLRPMVNNSRKNWKKGIPFNPVLILTGTELFWQSGLSEWQQKMEKKIRFIDYPSPPRSQLLAFCDFTQQVYLNMDP